ncbi:MAG: DUF1097 domain-containing protein [Selenomonadaceae bacterium]|nr:DUF1097 domain-containing protein [Selenomonadaceae bacterium]
MARGLLFILAEEAITMTYLISVGATVGILAGAWCLAADSFELIIFAGFLGWATYFAAGAGVKGVKLGLCSNLSGVIWGLATTALCGIFPDVPYYFFTIIFAAIMCWQAHVQLLSFIPGTFIGNATYYAATALGGNPIIIVVGLVCGIFLGLISDKSARLLTKREQ